MTREAINERVRIPVRIPGIGIWGSLKRKYKVTRAVSITTTSYLSSYAKIIHNIVS